MVISGQKHEFWLRLWNLVKIITNREKPWRVSTFLNEYPLDWWITLSQTGRYAYFWATCGTQNFQRSKAASEFVVGP